MKYADRKAVMCKIEWEGGLSSALEYGMSAEEMPDEELERLWGIMQSAYSQFEYHADIVMALLPELDYEDG